MQNLIDVQSRLAEDNTEYMTSHQLIEILDNEIKMKNTKTGETVTRRVDAVVMSVGYEPDKTSIESFSGIAPVVLPIGDAKEVKNIGMATRSGYAAAYDI
jgi:thioredoxin reductase